MTDEVKAIFDGLYKDLEGSPAHQRIMAKNISPVQADDKFHSLVMQVAKSIVALNNAQK
jgi:hypothetical protein